MKIIYVLLLLSIALNAQKKNNTDQQIYSLLLNEHLEEVDDIWEYSNDYGPIMKALDDLGVKGMITAKEKREIENILGIRRSKDTLVFNTEFAPKSSALKELVGLGTITSKEKRKIEKALKTGYLEPSPALMRYFERVGKVSPIAKDESYTERYFSKPFNLSMDKKVVFSKSILRSKKNKGGKAIGCANITFFSKNGKKWSIEDTICYETY